MVSRLEYTTPECPGSNFGKHTKIFQYFFLLFWYFRFYAYFSPLNWFFFLNIYKNKIKKRYVLLSVKCFEHFLEHSPNELASFKLVAKFLQESNLKWSVYLHVCMVQVLLWPGTPGFCIFFIIKLHIFPRAYRKRLLPTSGTTLTSNCNQACRLKLKRQIIRQ